MARPKEGLVGAREVLELCAVVQAIARESVRLRVGLIELCHKSAIGILAAVTELAQVLGQLSVDAVQAAIQLQELTLFRIARFQ